MLEDRLLVYKCRRGNKEVMCRLYEKYKDDLLTLAKGLLGEQAEAEDVVHDVFVSFREIGPTVSTDREPARLPGHLCEQSRTR